MSKKNIRQFDKEILKMYEEGYSSSYIADYFNVSTPGVIDRLRKYKVIRHSKRKNMTIKGYSLKEYDSKIIELYNNGYSMAHISKLLNIHRATVHYRLILNNVERRPIKGIKHSQRNPTVSLEFFVNKIKSNPKDFDYFLGLLASDGNVCENQIRINGISDENVEFLEHWVTFLENKVSIKRYLNPHTKIYYNKVVFKNQDIVNLLGDTYGIVPNKTFTVKLPYLNWNIIRGLFDGDGCLVKDKRCNSWKFEIVTASIELATQLNNFYIEQNLKSHLYKEKNYYKISILNRKDLQKVFINLYKDCSYFLKRKYDKFLPIIQETE